MPKPKRDFNDKTVVVTGAASGIGAALARRFNRAGAKLALLDIDAAGVNTLASELGGGRSLAIECDITDHDACRAAVDEARARFGGIDVLINNAGITHRSSFDKTDVSVFRRVMDVNYFGSLYCTKASLPDLIARRGLIIAVSSIAGFSPLYGRTGYAASKYALHGLFESLRSELSHTGAGVMMVCPGFTDTAITTAALGEDGRPTAHPQSTVGRVASPDAVADAVYEGACQGKRMLILTPVGRVSRTLNHLFPSLYERLMMRSLRSELQREH